MNTNPGNQIRIVTGGQFGSEGKGSYIGHVADQFPIHVRVGGPQAGHSVKLPGGQVIKFKVVPVGSIVPGTVCVIGMASVVDIAILREEMALVEDYTGRKPTVLVDPRATILDQDLDRKAEAEANQTERFGSTGKGIGKARERRIARTAGTADMYRTAIFNAGAEVEDTMSYLRSVAGVRPILIEAAQGQMLSLFSGGFYPYATSSECGPTQAFADTGLPLRYAQFAYNVGVFRTYPIRVAGNSGEMGGLELNWQTLQENLGSHIPEERTTVTNKIRRVATWDPGLARQSVRDTGLDAAVLTFLDYPFPQDEGKDTWHSLSPDARGYIGLRAKQLGIPIITVGTSFGTYVDHICGRVNLSDLASLTATQ